jgi:Skp family chaperone for outer membrane proteins
MKKLILVTLLLALPSAVLADDAADCAAGIEDIKARVAKAPDDAKLQKLLKDAEREAGEKEYEECLEAVEDAKEGSGG